MVYTGTEEQGTYLIHTHKRNSAKFGYCPQFRSYDESRIDQSGIMATELTVQSERAFQKQPHIFVNQKTKRTKSTRIGKGGRRWYKDVGLGFKTPKTAIEGTYIGTHPLFLQPAWTGCLCSENLIDLHADKKCPFTGQVSIRGRILTGTVVSTKMHRTLIIRREYLHFVPKYSRYEKRHKNLAAHVSPAFRVEEGDQVTVGQCRPLSKTVRNLAGHIGLRILCGQAP